MTLKLIVMKLEISKKKFIISNEIKGYCKELGLDYYATIKYLTRHKYLVRIFKGIFYIKSIEERKLNKLDTSYFEIIKEALNIKGVKNWYFGLETALKLNNITHEYFTVDYVVNDKLFRAKPILILGHKVRFVKLSPKLLSFGIIRDKISYSDPEKTLLDLFYLKHYSIEEFEELAKNLSKNKLIRYSKNYDKRTIKSIKEIT